MRIGFLSQPAHTVLPPAGSLEIWTREVARRLAERGHDVSIYGTRVRGQPDEVSEGIAYRFIDHGIDARLARGVRAVHRGLPRDRPSFASPAHPVGYWLQAARRIARDRCDVIHVYNYSQALPFLRRTSPQATIALHMQCEWLNQLARGMIARRIARADLVLGCSEYITGKIRRRFPEHGERMATLYNGVEIANGANGTERGRQAGLHLLHVGRIAPEKGHHVLFRAFNELVSEHPDLTLTLVGEEALIPREMAVDLFGDPEVAQLGEYYEGSYLERVKASLSEQARGRVRFAGHVSHEQASAYYRDADVFVFPSFFEAMPIPPIEAMAAGVPVVGSAVGGMVESVRDGETGLLVPRGDAAALAGALRRLIVDADLRAAYGSAGRRAVAERFSWDAVCDAFLELAGRAARN